MANCILKPDPTPDEPLRRRCAVCNVARVVRHRTGRMQVTCDVLSLPKERRPASMAADTLAERPCVHRRDVRTVEATVCGTCRRELEVGTCLKLQSECTLLGTTYQLVGDRTKHETVNCIGCREDKGV